MSIWGLEFEFGIQMYRLSTLLFHPKPDALQTLALHLKSQVPDPKPHTLLVLKPE